MVTWQQTYIDIIQNGYIRFLQDNEYKDNAELRIAYYTMLRDGAIMYPKREEEKQIFILHNITWLINHWTRVQQSLAEL